MSTSTFAETSIALASSGVEAIIVVGTLGVIATGAALGVVVKHLLYLVRRDFGEDRSIYSTALRRFNRGLEVTQSLCDYVPSIALTWLVVAGVEIGVGCIAVTVNATAHLMRPLIFKAPNKLLAAAMSRVSK